MDSKIKERCIYCGGDVYYHGDESLVKCDWCGQTIPVMKFQGEMTRMKKTEEENVRIKEQLKEAEKEKQAANDRLFAALSDLGQIQNSQDTLGKVVHLLTEGQGDTLQSLELLKGFSERLISTQNDIVGRMGLMQEIAIQLQKIDAAEQDHQSVMNEFILWSQQIREEDLHRLQGIAASAATLIEGQQEINSKVNELKAAADLHQQTLEAFQSQYTKDKLEKIQKLYRQAEDYQHDRMYDKAEEYYRRMLTEGEEDAEVYWRLIMCHYCLFYEKDEAGRMIPIILNPDLTDPAEMSLRKELIAHMTIEERAYYIARLQEIDQILDKYRLLKGETQYDVFISVKQDEGGHYTSDSDAASDLYDFLKGQGLRVFNSRRTPIPPGHEYEPYIISALISAKVLIVVGTKRDHMESRWVKNEWSRFQWLQFRDKEKTGKTERVLFCYLAKGMRAEEIPRALHPDRQAIYDGVKAHDELLAGLSFLIKKTELTDDNYGFNAGGVQGLDYRHIENQMKFWLVRGEYDLVLKKYEELSGKGRFLTYPSLHLAALCANQKVSDVNQLVNSAFILEDAVEYKTAQALCVKEEDRQKLQDLAARNRQWRDKKERNTEQVDESEKKNQTEIENRNAADNKPVSDQETIEKWYRQGLNAKVYRKDYAEAVKWYKKAAAHSHIEALYSLGECYYYGGKGLDKDEKKAFDYYQKAAELDHPGAQFTLANHYQHGYILEKDLKKAARWYQKSADQGYAGSQLQLGKLYEYGHGVERNTERALAYYKMAANQGITEAQERLESLEKKKAYLTSDNDSGEKWYFLGKYADEEKDDAEAFRCYKKSAELGYAKGQYELGICYSTPKGVTLDEEQAIYWKLKAAENGYAEAQYQIGLYYEIGIGSFKKDLKQARFWYQKAADQGHSKAKEQLDFFDTMEKYKKSTSVKIVSFFDKFRIK